VAKNLEYPYFHNT